MSPPAEDHAGEVLPVDRVGKSLGFEGKGSEHRVLLSAAPRDGGQHVARVEMHARLGSEDFQASSACRVPDLPHPPPAVNGLPQHEARVVSAAGRFDVPANGLFLSEIIGSARDASDFSRGYQLRVRRQVALGVQREKVVLDVAASRAFQVPVRVVREIHDCRTVGPRLPGDLQRAAAVQGIGDAGIESAWVPLLAVRAGIAERDAGRPAALEARGAPDAAVEAPLSSVQVVSAVVAEQRVRFSIYGELPAGNPVGDPPQGASEIGMRIQVSLQRIEAEGDIVH